MYDGCLWLEELIPITDMLIHRITWLPHSREYPTMVFGGKTHKRDLTKAMKDKLKLAKKLRGYAISSITDPVIKVAMQILVGKIMRKCHADEVSALVVALVG